MIKERFFTELCPHCKSEDIFFSKKNKRYYCEDCEEYFDKPIEIEPERNNTIDTRKIRFFLASSIMLEAERDLISSVIAESNGNDHGTYVYLDRCEYDNTIQIDRTQQDMYDSWIEECDVFVLLVSDSGMGEWTRREVERAVEKKSKNSSVRIYALLHNKAETGVTEENKRCAQAISEFAEYFDNIMRYDDLSDLYVKVKSLVDGIRAEKTLGKVIKGCLRTGYDIVITGISDMSRKFVYSLADWFNQINNVNFSENEKDSMIFNLKLVLDDPNNIRMNVNDYYFILTERNDAVAQRIGECFDKRTPYTFLDISVEESAESENLVKEISGKIGDNYLFMFSDRAMLRAKDTIRKRTEIVKKAYEDYQTGVKNYIDENYHRAIKYFEEAERFGFVDANFYLGCIYNNDTHDFFDLKKAEKYWRVATEQGNMRAQFCLASFLEKSGRTEEAEKYYRMAAGHGDMLSQLYFAIFLDNSGRKEEAEKYYRMAAEQEDLTAQLYFADFLERSGRIEEAEKYYRVCADQGKVAAQNSLALLLDKLLGQTEEAEKYYRMAADQGNAIAQFDFAELLKRLGRIEEAEKYYRMAADQGNVRSQSVLANLLEQSGRIEEAEKYYLMAAEQGDISDQIALADFFKNSGRPKEAEKYYRMAAERKDVIEPLRNAAKLSLAGYLYDLGRSEESIKYYRMAAEDGDMIAQVILKKLAQPEETEKYYRMAADQGNAIAQFDFAELLNRLDRIGEAEKYYRMAADQGNVRSQSVLANLLKQSGRIEEAEKYYLMAAEQGDISDQIALADFLKNSGQTEEAEKYYRMAAERKDVIAPLRNTARFIYASNLFAWGRNEESIKYYRMAAEEGDIRAQELLKGFAQMYTPNPADTSAVILDNELLELTEKIAENVHEVWARGRIAEGWKYGSERNDKEKTTPCLVPYYWLSEAEKEYDRNTALETLKLIIALGYKIHK